MLISVDVLHDLFRSALIIREFGSHSKIAKYLAACITHDPLLIWILSQALGILPMVHDMVNDIARRATL